MAEAAIPVLRLHAQRIAGPRLAPVRDAVRHMGAMQAQDYAASLWAIGLRMDGATLADIDAAVERREIARTWPMRGTLHWVAAEDLRWMVALMAPRAMAKAAARTRQLEIDADVLKTARDAFGRVLADGPPITRPEAYAVFAENGLNPEGQRGIHILSNLAHEGTLCFGPHRGKQPTFVLVDRWLPPAPAKNRDDALATLADRYFTSHGPATVRDFAWWTGLTLTDARAGLEYVKSGLERLNVGETEYWMAPPRPAPAAAGQPALHLLPGFDEYILGYQDRTAVLAPEFARLVVPGNNGMFMATIVNERGRVIGTWRRSVAKGIVRVVPEMFAGESVDGMGLEAAGERLGGFLGVGASFPGTVVLEYGVGSPSKAPR
jgi:hypothetical protein